MRTLNEIRNALRAEVLNVEGLTMPAIDDIEAKINVVINEVTALKALPPVADPQVPVLQQKVTDLTTENTNLTAEVADINTRLEAAVAKLTAAGL